jgi:hypothetical protein
MMAGFFAGIQMTFGCNRPLPAGSLVSYAFIWLFHNHAISSCVQWHRHTSKGEHGTYQYTHLHQHDRYNSKMNEKQIAKYILFASKKSQVKQNKFGGRASFHQSAAGHKHQKHSHNKSNKFFDNELYVHYSCLHIFFFSSSRSPS